MSSLEKTLDRLLGNKGEVDSERYFLTMTCLATSVFLTILVIVHLLMKLEKAPVFIAAGSAIALFGLYLLFRFTRMIILPKLLVTLSGLILLDLTWFTKYLSNGPVLYFIFAFGALVIWVWEGRNLLLMLLIYFANLAILGMIECLTPASEMIYSNPDRRIVDIYLSFFLYSILMIFLLQRIKKDFVRQKELAISSDKMKSAFLANMSHELRTPANSIYGFSELLEKESNPEKRHKYIQIIQSSSSNLLNIITDLIDLSKIEVGELSMNYSDTIIGELFDELKEVFRLELTKTNKTKVNLSYYLPDGELVIITDPSRLKQVLTNLIKNAVKFTNEGNITYTCKRIENDLIFSVTDSGTGIPDSDQKAIFQRFTSFNYKGLNTDGVGIGLSITENIISLLGGKIWLSSKVGEGSSFFFSIPYHEGRTISQKKQKSSQTSIRQLTNQKKVLIVEDDENSYLLLSEILQSFNVKIFHVADGKDAVDFILNNPDTALVLMDLRLPVLNGYDATARIRHLHPNLPIIAQTAYAIIGDKEKALKAGCDEYFSKPIDHSSLQRILGKYL